MKLPFRYDARIIELDVPDDAVVYTSRFPAPAGTDAGIVLAAVRDPVQSVPLADALRARRPGPVVIAVSDVTRPIPYARFLAPLLRSIEDAGVSRGEIRILIATGMHRPSTAGERRMMFGDEIVSGYRILDHDAQDDTALVELEGRSWSGSRVRIDRHFVEAGFRMVTGLVEPHFMAGFSGGRKTVCPGLAALESIQQFHGAEFLGNPSATSAVLARNPCHEEALSVARLAGVDFSLNVVIDQERRVVRAYAGELEAAHRAACDCAREATCRTVEQPGDIALTSSGGYPLDATFYQCVKGLVTCLPSIRGGGRIVAFGGCREGVGSATYRRIMRDHARRWSEFEETIRRPGFFVKDQWEFQMQIRALKKTGGPGRVHFVSGGLDEETFGDLAVSGVAVADGDVERRVQAVLDAALREGGRLSVFPEGPYCVAIEKEGVDTG